MSRFQKIYYKLVKFTIVLKVLILNLILENMNRGQGAFQKIKSQINNFR